jgi:hypothetical protein
MGMTWLGVLWPHNQGVAPRISTVNKYGRFMHPPAGA